MPTLAFASIVTIPYCQPVLGTPPLGDDTLWHDEESEELQNVRVNELFDKEIAMREFDPKDRIGPPLPDDTRNKNSNESGPPAKKFGSCTNCW
jgi:hypothetical protein